MTSSDSRPVLSIEGLSIAYRFGNTWLEAVRDFSLVIQAAQTYGLVGESGSGKSTLALAVMRYLGEQGKIEGGHIRFLGRDLLALSETDLHHIWGKEISFVPQDPHTALNPSIRIGEQVAEVLRHHQKMSHSTAARRAIEWLQIVRISDPERVASSYPHQISGGMQQRVMIAMALSTRPALLILDEPTTNLDVTTQAAILDLFDELMRQQQTSSLYVTHNLGVVARICDRVAVLYAGELVEDATTQEIFTQPLHPYTQGLLDSVPQPGTHKAQVQLKGIPGQIPPLHARPSGCVFAPRCPLAIEHCFRERPALDSPSPSRRVRCHRWPEIASGTIIQPHPLPKGLPSSLRGGQPQPVLDLQGLKVHFAVRRSLTELLTRTPAQKVKAVDGVDLTISRGQTLGLVGESGSGKTTLARAIVGLAERCAGRIELLGISLPSRFSQRTVEMLRQMQYVFQNPDEALNPYLTIGETLRRPLINLLSQSRKQAEAQVEKLLKAVRLPADYKYRLPGQLSGGEKQRVAIARAFASHPELLVADEAVSSLDVSVQASILNLLAGLQAEYDNALLFISHDLAVVAYLADRVAVMYLGHLMDIADAEDLFDPPYHPYTEALLSAIPLTHPQAKPQPLRLKGDVPSQISPPSGCPFHPRCPRFLGEVCVQETPPWQVSDRGRRIFCHIPLEELCTQ